jgi:transcription initiation factor TFIIIB Brf1 subunit/transcription initiation factor TFIIB
MSQTACPECGGPMVYELSTKHFQCKRCGLYVTREQLDDIKAKIRDREEDDRKKRRRIENDYLAWWLSGKK